MNDLGWQAPETAPIDGTLFLAELSTGWVVVMWAGAAVTTPKPRFAWWRCAEVSVPYEPSHPAASFLESTVRLTGWQPIPKSRQDIAREAANA